MPTNPLLTQTPATIRRPRWGLTPRELDILHGLYAGQTPREMSAEFGTSRRTVEAQIVNLRKRYRASNVVKLMREVEQEAASLGHTDLLDLIDAWQQAAYVEMRRQQAAQDEAVAHQIFHSAFAAPDDLLDSEPRHG